MKTGDTKCFGCNQGYLNCYQTCPNSPARNNDISLTPIQTPDIDHCENGYKREMHIKAEVAREIFEEIENIVEDYELGKFGMYTLLHEFAELKKKYIPQNAERCVVCGYVIPEGRQVCPKCEGSVEE